MGKFDGILLVTDLDGTLLKNDCSVSEENVKAIEYFKSQGGLFSIVTGRLPSALAGIDEIVKPNAPIGCINGGGIYDLKEKKYVWTEIAPKEILELVAYVDKEMPEIGHQVNTLGNLWFTKYNDAMIMLRDLSKLPDVTCRIDEIKDPVLKVVFADFDHEKIKLLAEKLQEHPLMKDFEGVSSEPIYYEILPKGISKAVVIPKLCEMLGISMDRTIAVGDNNNDVTMLNTVKLGYAVANASESAKQAADRITVSNQESAIAKIVEELDNGTVSI